MLRLAVCAILTIGPFQTALAQSFPNPNDICANGIVVKAKLAKAFVKADAAWLNLYVDADVSAPEPQWRRIFTDENFCTNNPGCLAKNPDKKVGGKEVIDAEVAKQTLIQLRFKFAAALQGQTGPGKPYQIADYRVGANYFLGNDRTNAITCVPENLHAEATPAPGIKMPTALRLRASADELNIPVANKPAFKGTKPAKITYKNDGVDERTQTVALVGALGYAIPLDFDKLPASLDYFTGELVPYVAADETLTKKHGTAATFSASSYIATGVLFNTRTIFADMPGVTHVLSAKPQYLWNSKDRSEITSIKGIYAPWSVTPAGGHPSDPKINTPFQPGGILGDSTLQLLFDLRYHSGYYNNRGIDPATAAQHVSFSRGGTRFGFALVTPSDGPHTTLTVTQTMLYGFSGEVRQLNLFEAELAYYFDKTSNFAFTISYKRGRDEDTAEEVQTLMLGLAAKF